MDATFSYRERMVGLFLMLTLALALGALVLVARGKNWFAQRNTYHTVFKEGYGLKEGSTVKMFNTEIGEVRSVTINDMNEVEVTLAVLADYAKKIRADSVATVASPTLVGSEYIAITPGTPGKPQTEADGYIAPQAKKSISDYVEEFKLSEKAKKLSEVLDSVNKMAGDLAAITAELRRPGGPLMGTLADVKALTAGLRAGRGTAGKLLVDDALYARIDRMSAHLEQTAANVNELAASMKPLSAEIPAMTRELNQSVKGVKEIIENVKKGTQDLPALMTGVDETVAQARRLVESAKTLPLLRSNLPPDTRRDQADFDPRGM
jgi:phospholipid/cholesterol/gamma-HCH transport system substrate-binding protein